ncbi:armadillo-type protein [Crepidotus variabilis]|uniref:Armadillo-type protein n=1 Tax=Crepidotus variabilis TaxID=179855 RepID=A0A9P6JUM0_9AGAR|nr:armadillo-type protein [Crepidotus variabilis]
MASPVSARSALMESFRNGNRDKQWTLQDIFGHIVEFSGDQNGSRLIQQQLEVANEEDRQRVFDEIVPEKTDQLVQDVFGNYVIQKFFELGSPSQKDFLSQALETNVIKYSLQIYACRVVQKAFEYMPEEQQDRLISTIEENFLLCVKDEHGNHVIQKLVETMLPERLTFLQFISNNICEVATNSNGCRVLQKCLMKLSNQHSRPLLDAIHRQANTLMRDQYGNYVMQFILQHGQEQDRALAIGRVRGSLVRLSKNQYASHVCEKAIVHSAPEVRHILLEELANPRPGENPILVMIKDDYANYVLQKALTESEGEQKEVLYQRVKTALIPLRRMTTSYNKQLIKSQSIKTYIFIHHIDSWT